MSRKFFGNLVIVAIVSLNFMASASAFSDSSENDWYFPYTQKLVAAGIIDGSKPTFDPLSHVTREMAAKVIVKAAGYTDARLVVPENPSFKDVPKSSWSYPYIETAKSLGFVTGYGGSIYAPGKEVSRAEFAIMIMRAFKLEKNTDGAPHFSDVQATDWFYDAVETSRHWAIINGYGDETFRPYNLINRAEMSKMLVWAMKVPAPSTVTNPVSTPENKPKNTGLIIDNKVVDKPKVTDNTSGSSGTSGLPSTQGTPDNSGTGASGTPVVTPTENKFTDDFSVYTPQYFADSATFNSWFVQFTGFGTVGIEADGNNKFLHLSPQVADSAGVTHSSLVTGPLYNGPIQFEAKMMTVQQLRTGSTPNPWEVAWMVWNYTDNNHFYYFIPKTNGWELGKRDPTYPGGQRFLATGTDAVFPIGQWYDVKITQDAMNNITVWVNGAQITTFTDTEKPYTSGNIGFYTEDAHVQVDDVSVTY